MINYTIIQKSAKNPKIKNAKIRQNSISNQHLITIVIYVEFLGGFVNMQNYPLYEDMSDIYDNVNMLIRIIMDANAYDQK